MPRVVGRKQDSERRELEKTGIYFPMKATLVNTRIKGYKIPLPSGLEVELSRNNHSFILASKEDEDFVIKHCKGIILQDLNHDDFVRWVNRDILPHLKISHTEDEVQKFIWKDEYEDEMIKHLRKHGYIVTKEEDINLDTQHPEDPKDTEDTEKTDPPVDPNQITMDDILSDDKNEDTPKPTNPTVPAPDPPIVTSTELTPDEVPVVDPLPEETPPEIPVINEAPTEDPIVADPVVNDGFDINLSPDLPEAPELTEDEKNRTSDNHPTVIFVCSKEEMDRLERLRAIAAARGYKGNRMRSKKNYIDWIKLSLKENEALPDDN